ncbi:RICIN domain-containing protein [Streptomyces sp. NPDC057740]|uniref:RICIN domain-containing protein n=1 Tax=Streptomyces sp. NPDC057740 TaxID=3346234 RepID=UPI00367FB274
MAVASGSTGDLFLNTQNGDPNAWTRIQSNVAAGYSRGLLPLSDGHSLEVCSGGPNGSSVNPVTYSTIDLGGGISDGATYTASHAGSNLNLTIAGGSTTNGTAATQQTPTTSTNQQWRFAQQPSGYFKIYNIASGKVLGVQGQSTADGAAILQWDDSGTLDHEWAVAPHTAGGYTITNRVTGKLLEIPDASTTVGATAAQWSSTGCACQRWNLTQTAPAPARQRTVRPRQQEQRQVHRHPGRLHQDQHRGPAVAPPAPASCSPSSTGGAAHAGDRLQQVPRLVLRLQGR